MQNPLFKSTFFVLIFLISNSVYSQIETLEKALKESQTDTARLQILTDLNWEYLSVDLEKAKKVAEEELTLAETVQSERFIAQAYNDLALVEIKNNRFKEGLALNQKALEIRVKIGNKLDLASSYSKIGYCYSELDLYGEALKNQLLALEIYKELGDKIKVATTLNNLCYLYSAIYDWDNNIKLANQAYQIGKEMNNPTIIAVAVNNIGSSFEKKNDFKSAVLYKLIALKEFEKLQDSVSMATMMNNIGYYYRNMGQNKEAANYYNSGLNIAIRQNDINSIAIFYSNLGALNIDLGNYVLAESFLLKSKNICLNQSIISTLIPVYKSLGDLYALTGKGLLAKENYSLYASIKDSLFNSDLVNQFSEMQTRYETNEKEAKNLLLQKENQVNKAELSRSNIIKWLLVIAICFLFSIFYLVFQKNKLKQQKIIAAERITQQQILSKSVLDAEEKERQRIARDLHDGLGQRLSATKLNISGLQSLLNNPSIEQDLLLKNASTLIDESVKDVRSISHNLLSNGLLKSGLVTAIREFVNQLNHPNGIKINLEIIGLEKRLEFTLENVLYRVLQEVINNIIKHSKARQVNIQIIKHDSELSMVIEDDGIGFDINQILLEKKGIGLKNIESRIEFVNGKVFFDSYPGKGTTVNFEVPL
jgi:two-component system, NarL family, sensor kinase